MCTFPKIITNPVKRFHTYFDKVSLTVPCGHCEDCRNSKRAEWTVRAYYEYLDSIDNHGFVLAPTLTYDDDYLPMYNGIPVFDKNHIQLFLKRLRKRLFSEYHRNIKLRYLICSEYGGTTARPHYHGLIFIKEPGLSVVKVMHFLNESWQYGFVGYSKKKGALIKCQAGIKYAVKYIVKDLDFIRVTKDMEIPLENQSRHYQSKGFGEYAIQKLNLNNNLGFSFILENYVPYPLNCSGKPYALPSYYSRKILQELHYKSTPFLENGVLKNKKQPYFVRKSEYFTVYAMRLGRMVDKETEQNISLINSIPLILYGKERLEVFNRDTNSDFATVFDVWSVFENQDINKISIANVYYNNRLVDNLGVSLDTDLPIYHPFLDSSLSKQKFLMCNYKSVQSTSMFREDYPPDTKIADILRVKYGIYNNYLTDYYYLSTLLNELKRLYSLYNLNKQTVLNKQKSNLKILQPC